MPAKDSEQRNTRQKRAIRKVFESAGGPLSPDEVYEVARREIDSLGIATVYRSIRSLHEDGWLAQVEVPGKGVLYELAGKSHHHHFSCTKCRRVYELEGCSSEIVAHLPKNFRASGHDVTIYGLCSACIAKTSARKKRL